jgi:hypothetical protein
LLGARRVLDLDAAAATERDTRAAAGDLGRPPVGGGEPHRDEPFDVLERQDPIQLPEQREPLRHGDETDLPEEIDLPEEGELPEEIELPDPDETTSITKVPSRHVRRPGVDRRPEPWRGGRE